MKKLLFACVLLMAATAVKAQTEKGNVMIGGSIQFQSSEGSTIFMADPNVGFFFANNFAAGAQLTLISGEGTTIWGIGPYVRGYFGKSMKGKVFAQAGASFAGISDGGGSTSAFQGKLGYAYFLNKNVAMEFAANFMAGEGSTVFGMGIGFQIHLK
ncbi:MAG TPA: hypothetical protein VF145_11905 [Chitinophagaceae bacterium]